MASRRAVVIGTGAGGLAAAAYLARDGFDVTALDQADRVGGFLAPFRREGFEFDPGVHYVGECRPGGLTHAVLAGIGIDATALFAELDPGGFDVYRFPHFEMRMCRGEEAYRERLVAAFPSQARGIARVFHAANAFHSAALAMMLLDAEGIRAVPLGALRHAPTMLRWSGRTYGELLGHMVSDAKARAVLAAPCGDYGLPPSRASNFGGLMCLRHYLGGAFFPRGGSGALRDALVAATERRGGHFLTGMRAEKILTRDGRATAVLLPGGEKLEADVVVSAVDPTITLGRLLDASVVPGPMREKVRRIEPSLGTVAVYLGLRRDLGARGLRGFNVWDYPTWDVDAAFAPLFRDELPAEPAFFLSPNSLKDDTHALAPAGGTTLEIYTFAPYARFARWRERPVGARGADYEGEKRRVADWLLAAVERRWPGLVGDVAVEVVATPLTNESYVGAVQGGIYGPAMTPEQTGAHRFSPSTTVPNLFLAGAGVFGDGVTSCLESGRVAAKRAARAVARERSSPRSHARAAHA